MHFFANLPNANAYYEPNFFQVPAQSSDYRELPLRISGDADRYDHREGNDDFSQPHVLWFAGSLDPERRAFCRHCGGAARCPSPVSLP
jgi:catalase